MSDEIFVQLWHFHLSVTPRVQKAAFLTPFIKQENSFQTDILPHVLLCHRITHSRIAEKCQNLYHLFLHQYNWRIILVMVQRNKVLDGKLLRRVVKPSSSSTIPRSVLKLPFSLATSILSPYLRLIECLNPLLITNLSRDPTFH